MDRGRQQYSRNQRYNSRNCYQQNTENDTDCGCDMMNRYSQNKACGEECPLTSRDSLGGMPLGMGYVPWQQFENLYEECEAVYHGTIFCDLDLDFCGVRCE